MWNAVPEVRDTWPGAETRHLAQSLVWKGERFLFLDLIGAPDAMSSEEFNEVGTAAWMRPIYLADGPDPV